MSAKRLHVVVPGIVGPTSRREFLRYGGGVAGASLVAPYWPRSAVAQSVSTFDFYISPTGNDSNPGSQAAPWSLLSLLNPRVTTAYNSTIQANQAKMAGKRIGVLPGTYNLQSYVSRGFGQDYQEPVLIVPSGTSASAMTLLQSTQQLGAIIDFGLTDANNGGSNAMPAIGTSGNSLTQWVIIDGFELRNTNEAIVRVGAASTGGQIIVRNNYVHGVRSTSSGANPTGIVGYWCNGLLIQNNYVTDIVNSNNRNTCIETWACINQVIEYNTCIMSNGGAGAIYVKNANQHDATIRYNYCDLSAAPSLGGNGVCAWDLVGAASSTSAFHHNIILSNGQGACFDTGIAGVNNGSTAEKRLHYNNTFVGAAAFSAYCISDQGSGAFFTGYNNIFARTSVGGSGDVTVLTGTVAIENYNLFQTAPRAAITGTNYSSLAALQAAGYDTHSILGAPTFVGGSPTFPAQKYQLASGSLGKGTGSSNGQTSGTAIDMGAWGGIDVNTGHPIAQIGANFAPGSPSTTSPTPVAPVLTVS